MRQIQVYFRCGIRFRHLLQKQLLSKMFHGQDQRGSLVAHTAHIPIQSSNRETEVLVDKVGIPRQHR